MRDTTLPNAPACRLLPYEVADGPHNMAADQVLLESSEAGTASLRFYGWSGATVSLGYFQPERLRCEDARLAGLPFVRRPSGGGALVHHHELTYALALPPGLPWQPKGQPSAAWLCRMHGIIAAALASFGIGASPAPCRDEQGFGGLLCFQKITPGDLLIRGAKVVGSAQRRQRGALLQHGGILLAASPHAPALPGVAELTGRRLSVPDLCRVIGKEFARETGWDLVPSDWSAEECQRIEASAHAQFGTARWNARR